MSFLVVMTLKSRIPRKNHQVLTTANLVKAVSQNVLSGLNRAKPASISRTRALKLNPPGEQKWKRCGPSTKLRRKSLHDCVVGFRGEHLVVECGVLFCEACRVEVSPKTSSLKSTYSLQPSCLGEETTPEGYRASAVNRAIYEQLRQ